MFEKRRTADADEALRFSGIIPYFGKAIGRFCGDEGEMAEFMREIIRNSIALFFRKWYTILNVLHKERSEKQEWTR